MRGIFIAGKLLANLSSNCECAWLPLTGEKIDSAALSFTRVLSSFDTLCLERRCTKIREKKTVCVYRAKKSKSSNGVTLCGPRLVSSAGDAG